MGIAPKTSIPDPAPTPVAPETVRRADADAKKTRAIANAGASARGGVGASDLTKGALAMTGPALQKQKLGGQ